MADANVSSPPISVDNRNLFPDEVFDLIFFYIDLPVDLLSCSLTCKRLSNIISPEHLQYCKIRSGILRHQLWKHLAANPRLAARIRALEIYEELDNLPRPIIPPCVRDQTVKRVPYDSVGREVIKGAANELILAVHCMPNLKRFYFRLSQLILAVVDAVGEHCRDLDTLAFVDTVWSLDSSIPKYTQFLSHFQNLRAFSYTNPLGWRSFGHPNMRNDRLKAFRELLHDRCPNLEELHLMYETSVHPVDLPGILNGANWPNLKLLSVTAAVLQEDYVQFFELHPHIERLRIFEMDLQFYHFDCSTLSSLRSLDIDWLIVPCRPKNPFEFGSATERIEDLSITLLTERPPPPPFIHLVGRFKVRRAGYDDLNFLAAFSNLRQLVLQSRVAFTDPLRTLLRIVPPTIEWLAYRPLDDPIEFIEDVGPVLHSFSDTISDIAQLLGRLPNLSHLGLINLPPKPFAISGSDDHREVGSAIETLSNATLKLRFVGFHLDGSSETSQSWWKIERTATGSFLSCVEVSKVKWRDDVDVDSSHRRDHRTGALYRWTV